LQFGSLQKSSIKASIFCTIPTFDQEAPCASLNEPVAADRRASLFFYVPHRQPLRLKIAKSFLYRPLDGEMNQTGKMAAVVA
jgi:hypothetical protein